MINFFRKIRKKYANDNRPIKYFRYAIGEIVLVVIGILIALQVNNWNVNRLNLKIEKQLINAINEKMKYNNFQYEMGYTRYNEVIEAARELIILSNTFDSLPSPKKLDYLMHNLTKRFLLGKSNETSIYDEMIGSGQLSLLSSIELRKNLTALKANLELLASYEEIQNNFVDFQLNPYLNKYVDKISIASNGYSTDKTDYDKQFVNAFSNLGTNNTVTMYSEFITDKEFKNLLVDLIYYTQTLIPIYNRIQENIKIIESLTMNINK
jgi:hypothetical protein